MLQKCLLSCIEFRLSVISLVKFSISHVKPCLQIEFNIERHWVFTHILSYHPYVLQQTRAPELWRQRSGALQQNQINKHHAQEQSEQHHNAHKTTVQFSNRSWFLHLFQTIYTDPNSGSFLSSPEMPLKALQYKYETERELQRNEFSPWGAISRNRRITFEAASVFLDIRISGSKNATDHLGSNSKERKKYLGSEDYDTCKWCCRPCALTVWPPFQRCLLTMSWNINNAMPKSQGKARTLSFSLLSAASSNLCLNPHWNTLRSSHR